MRPVTENIIASCIMAIVLFLAGWITLSDMGGHIGITALLSLPFLGAFVFFLVKITLEKINSNS
jgi:hypothetical protein